MTKDEFNIEFNELKAGFNTVDNKLGWHDFVERNLHKMSDEALHYIVENPDGYIFGQWMVNKAVDLTVFEDIVLRGK